MTLTYQQAQAALTRDHANGMHGRSWLGCPVCEYVRTMPEWRRRRLEASAGRIVAVQDTTGTVAL